MNYNTSRQEFSSGATEKSFINNMEPSEGEEDMLYYENTSGLNE